MLRIGESGNGDGVVLHLQGRLAGPWAEELRRVLAGHAGSPARVVLDLAGVGFVDESGQRVLRQALESGVRIGPRSGFVASLLEGWERGQEP